MARISYLRQVELEGKAKDIYDGLPIKLGSSRQSVGQFSSFSTW